MEDVVVVGGGQSGLAAARTLRATGLRPLVLEAGSEPVGSWPHYYDSLRLFSPAAYSGFPGFPFPGDPGRYPARDEVTAHLRDYAATLDVEIRTECRVTSVTPTPDGGFVITPEAGAPVHAAALVAATGSFGSPSLPSLPGLPTHPGRVLHSADYRSPQPFAGERVVVVGAGDSAVQIAYELARVARVTIASRRRIGFLPQRIGGHDLHYWLARTGFDDLPPEWLARVLPGTLVTDTGRYRAAIDAGRPDWRPMFTSVDGRHVVWSDGTREPVDSLVFATGYRPHLDYLRPMTAFTHGHPQHARGISVTHPGLAYLGIEFQRSYASNTLRGVHADAAYVAAAISAHARKAGSLVLR